MSRHHRAACVLCLAFALAVPALAQNAIAPAIKNGSIGARERQTIESFIADQLQKLAGADPSAQTAARDAILQEALLDGSAAPPAYLDAYADVLAKGLLKILAPEAPPRQRLLAAIVAAKVADIARNTRLLDVVLLELKDPSTPVVLWGMKGARAILPAVLNNALLRQQGQLPAQMLAAVERVQATPVLQEAYGAATLGLFAAPPRQPSAAEVQTAVPLVQDLLAFRLKAYQQGSPDEPTIENLATLFLSHPNVWPQQSTVQKQRTAQLFMDLLSFASQRFEGDAAAMTPVIQQTSKALYILTGNADLQNALVPLTRLTPQTPASQVHQQVQSAYQALTAIADFKSTTQPAQLPASTTEPAGQP